MRTTILSMGLLLTGTLSVRADEQSIKVADLPRAVAAAVKTKYPKGELSKAVKEEEKGKTTYEVVVEIEGKKLDVAVSDKGNILEVEEAIAAESLPKEVASAIKASILKPGSRRPSR